MTLQDYVTLLARNGPADTEAAAKLVPFALDALRAGVRPRLEDLADRTSLTAWRLAAAEHRAEQLEALAHATSGDRRAALATSDLDDGQAASDAIVARLLEAARGEP